jgi:hypothetical protein
MKLFDPKVQLEPVAHKYFNTQTGQEYTSVSKLLGKLGTKFDSDLVSARVAKSRGVAQEVVLQEWKNIAKVSTDHGTRIHNALERYSKYAQVLPEDEDLRQMIMDVCSSYSDYYQVYDELTLYHDDCFVAGTSDKILMISKSSSSKFDVEDYKTNLRNGIETFNKYGNRLLAPFDYLEDCSFVKYSLQLSIYAYMFECLTGKKCRKLGIRYIPAENYMNHQYIPVMYMKPEVEHIFAMRKKQLQNGK